jgi:hypothetical protein
MSHIFGDLTNARVTLLWHDESYSGWTLKEME